MTAQVLNLNGVEAIPNTPPFDGIDENRQILNRLIDAMGLSNRKDSINEFLPYDIPALALVDLLNVMARLGFPAKQLALKPRDIDPRLLPCLFVEGRSGRLCLISEPNTEEVSGTAYFFAKSDVHDAHQEEEERKALGRSWTVATIKRFRKLIINVFALSLALNVVSLGLPVLLMLIYDRVVDISSENTIYSLGLGAILLLIIELSLRQLRSHSLSWFAARFDHLINNQVLSKILKLPASSIENSSVSSHVARLRSFESFREFFVGPLLLTFLDLPFVILALALLTIIAGSIVFIPIAAVGFFIVVLLVFIPLLKLTMFRAAQARSNAQSHQIELIEKIQALRLNGMSEIWADKFRDISAIGSVAMFRSQFMSQALETIVHMIALFAGVGVIYAGVNGVWSGYITGGAVFASVLLVWRILVPLQTLSGNIPRFLQIRQTFQQIDKLMDLKTERERASGLAKPIKIRGQIEFSKVGLRYRKNSDPVFVGLSFTAEPGEFVAIAGGNGSGKSTVLKLALGLYRPQAGAIYLDDSDIRQIDPTQLRKQMAYVPQIPEMFEGTIAENIRLCQPTANERQLWDALRFAGVEDDVLRLPLGLETPISGVVHSIQPRLTFGISISRALVKDSSVILLDEVPYAILNSQSGATFMNNIAQLRGKKTILMVSHREDHIKLSDQTVGLLGGDRFMVGPPDRIIEALRVENEIKFRRQA